uniref:Mor transcription activator domain-containing protein n=1 Tax=uncultured Spirochaetaceae bacterium TaxID=201186 RepID=A0A650EP32_9SPIO|nr:hypothetical protein Unknown280_0180 [uncultured Spirochaetaceae bacterium]
MSVAPPKIVEAKNIMDEMVSLCVMEGIARATAVKALRGLCRYFGGQQIFLPRFKRNGSDTGDTVRGVIDDEVGDAEGDKICDTIMRFFGGVPIYIPFERRAFRVEVAMDIYEQYDGTQDKQRELCRQFQVSFTHFYRLWHLADEKKKKTPTLFDFSDAEKF